MACVAVIDGSYGGVTVAKELDPIADVVLIKQKDQFAHHAAALRIAADTVWGHVISMLYINLLRHDEVFRDVVSRVDGTTVHVFDHDLIEVNYVVFATGSTYPFLTKYSSHRPSTAEAHLGQLHGNLGRARSVMVISGGTVGTELTGELANTFPGLDIMIIEASDQILGTPDYTDILRNGINEQLNALGMHIVTDPELVHLPPQNVDDLSHFMAETKNDEIIGTGLWFRCHGTRANAGFLIDNDYESIINLNGTIRINNTMEVANHPNVYAVGDLTNVCKSKCADATRQQARVIIANIAAQIEGEKPDAIYQPTKEWVILSLGLNVGAPQLPDADGQTRILGAEQTAKIKGTDLMVSVARSQLNLL